MHGESAQIFNRGPVPLPNPVTRLDWNFDLISPEKGATIAGLLLGNLH